jgi:NADH-quinone oxidoreductase subunit J
MPGSARARTNGMVVSFGILSVIILLSSVMVITRSNPMHSALWLFVTFLGLAGVYLLLGAEFVAAIQVIVYAGGVLVLYIFVIMLVNLTKEETLRLVFQRPAQTISAFVMAILVMAIILWERGIFPQRGRESAITYFFVPGKSVDLTNTFAIDTTRALAKKLFLTYLYPFEIASILLLVAMIGAVVVARRSSPTETETEKDS